MFSITSSSATVATTASRKVVAYRRFVTVAGQPCSLPPFAVRPIPFHSLRHSLFGRRRPSVACRPLLPRRPRGVVLRGPVLATLVRCADFSAEAFERIFGARASELAQLLESQTLTRRSWHQILLALRPNRPTACTGWCPPSANCLSWRRSCRAVVAIPRPNPLWPGFRTPRGTHSAKVLAEDRRSSTMVGLAADGRRVFASSRPGRLDVAGCDQPRTGTVRAVALAPGKERPVTPAP